MPKKKDDRSKLFAGKNFMVIPLKWKKKYAEVLNKEIIDFIEFCRILFPEQESLDRRFRLDQLEITGCNFRISNISRNGSFKNCNFKGQYAYL